MKFLLIVLAVQLMAEVLTRKKDKSNVHEAGMIKSDVRHPAEFELR